MQVLIGKDIRSPKNQSIRGKFMIERKHANRLLASLTCFIMNKLKHVLGEGYLYSEIRVEQVGNCLVGAGSCEGKRRGVVKF